MDAVVDQDVPGAGRAASVRGWVAAELRMGLEVLGLTGLVVTQPVLAIFQRSPDVFVLRRAEVLDVVIFAVAVALVPAVVLWVIGASVGLAGAGPRRVAHVVTLGLLGGVLVLLTAEDLTGAGKATLVVLALVGAGLAGWAAWRWAVARLLCRYLAVGGLLFVGVFLFASPVAPVVSGGDVATAELSIDDPAPMVMIVFDELPTVSLLDDQAAIDADRFPSFAALAGDATWYRNHSTVAPVTPTAVPAILTGDLPEPDTVPLASAHPDNLFTLLGGTYDVRATESLTQLCPSSVCAGRPDVPARVVVRSLLGTATELWRERLDPDNRGEVDFTVSDQWFDPASPSRLSEFAPSLAPSQGRPRLDFLHVLLPHQPWNLLPDGSEYDAASPPPGAPYLSVWDDQHAADVARQRHVLQLQYVDRQLGVILDRMRELGTYDESLIVITADHGVAFTEEAATRAVFDANYHEIMWTPFVVKAPGQETAEVVDTPMQSIDDVPTIAGALGVEVPFAMDGTAGGPGDPGDGPDKRLMLDYRFNEARPDEGNFLELDGRVGFARLLATDPLGEPEPGLGLYRLGPDADLVGRDLGDLTVGPGLASEATVTTAGAYLAGVSDGSPRGRVALVVDGVVVATPTLYDDGRGEAQFFAMVPPRWRPDDAAAVSVHVIEGTADARVLRPMTMR